MDSSDKPRKPTNDEDEAIRVELSHDDALVLFDWLSRTDGSVPISDPAEQDALWRLEAQLEKQLAEVISSSYDAAVEAARRRLRPRE